VSATTHATIAVLAGLSISCFGRPTYECSADASCIVGDAVGVCEPEGVCSYLDEACPSGRRYGPYAGDLAEACVPEGGTGSGDASTSSSSATTMTSVVSSEDSSGETSCVSDCPQRGEEVWSTIANELGVGRAHGMAIGGSRIAIVGEITIEDRIAMVVGMFAADDGAFVSSFEWPSSAGGPDRGRGIAALGEDALVVAGSETTPAGDERGVLFRLDDARTVAWSVPYDTAGTEALHAVAVDASDRIFAVGTSDARAIVLARDAQGSELYTRVFGPPPDTMSALLGAVAVTQGGAALLGGSIALSGSSSDAWIRGLGPDAAIVLDVRFEGPTNANDIAHAVASMPDGSVLVGGVLADDAWLARFDAAGSVRSTATLPDRDTVRAIALADDGTVIAAGDAWLAAYDPEESFEELWTAPTQATEALALTLAGDIAYVAGHRDDTIWLGAYAL
jgi:hypothetical protein